jgi:hypothetical protein
MSTNDRANVKNVNNPASKAAADNHANQKNPAHVPSTAPKGKKYSSFFSVETLQSTGHQSAMRLIPVAPRFIEFYRLLYCFCV